MRIYENNIQIPKHYSDGKSYKKYKTVQNKVVGKKNNCLYSFFMNRSQNQSSKGLFPLPIYFTYEYIYDYIIYKTTKSSCLLQLKQHLFSTELIIQHIIHRWQFFWLHKLFYNMSYCLSWIDVFYNVDEYSSITHFKYKNTSLEYMMNIFWSKITNINNRIQLPAVIQTTFILSEINWSSFWNT